MSKHVFAFVDEKALRAKCIATIAEYNERHVVGLAYRDFLIAATAMPRVTRPLAINKMRECLEARGFAESGAFRCLYRKDTDFMGRDRFHSTVVWSQQDWSDDTIEWVSGMTQPEIDGKLSSFSLLEKHAAFLRQRLGDLPALVEKHNKALADLKSVAESAKCGIFAAYPLSDAFHYYELT